MPKPDISMTADELTEFLRQQDHGVLGYLDERGEPTAGLVSIREADAGFELTPVPPGLPVGAETCLTCEREPSYGEIRAAMVLGPVTGRHGSSAVVRPRRAVSFDFGKIPPPASS